MYNYLYYIHLRTYIIVPISSCQSTKMERYKSIIMALSTFLYTLTTSLREAIKMGEGSQHFWPSRTTAVFQPKIPVNTQNQSLKAQGPHPWNSSSCVISRMASREVRYWFVLHGTPSYCHFLSCCHLICRYPVHDLGVTFLLLLLTYENSRVEFPAGYWLNIYL